MKSRAIVKNRSVMRTAEAQAHRMKDEVLAAHVQQGLSVAFRKIADELPYIKELRKRFAALPRGRANIAGCKTWTDFCGKVLHRTDRHIRRVLAPAFVPTLEEQTGHSVRLEQPVQRVHYTVVDVQEPTTKPVHVHVQETTIHVPCIVYKHRDVPDAVPQPHQPGHDEDVAVGDFREKVVAEVERVFGRWPRSLTKIIATLRDYAACLEGGQSKEEQPDMTSSEIVN